jgi:bifunctional DNase/RNase
MISVRIAGIALDQHGQHVILLKPVDDALGSGRVLPIWIGELESSSILVAVQGVQVSRPLAHDLIARILAVADAKVERAAVTRIEDGTFYAELTVQTPTGSHTIDCRPSDAIAVASRLGVALGVEDDVLETAGFDDVFTTADEEENVEQFKQFLDSVDPSDFQTGSDSEGTPAGGHRFRPARRRTRK